MTEIADIKDRNELLADGIWIEQVPNLGNVRLKVRPLNSPIVVMALSREQRNIAPDELNQHGQIPWEVQEEIDRLVLCSAALLDWDNLTDGGQPVPFSQEQALEWAQIESFWLGLKYAVRLADRRIEKQAGALEKN